MIETALFTILSTDAPILTLLPATRMHPAVLEQDTAYPAIMYRRIASEVVRSMTSYTVIPTFQINGYAETYVEAKDLADKIQTAMTGSSGVIAGVTPVTKILSVTFDNDEDMYSDELDVYFVSSDFTVEFCEI